MTDNNLNDEEYAEDSERNDVLLNESEPRRLYKSKNNFYIFGVCGGIAEYFLVPPFFIRTVFLLTMLFGGWGLIFYIAAALLIPAREEVVSSEISEITKSQSKIEPHKLFGTLILITGIYLLVEPYGIHRLINLFGIPQELLFILFVITAGILLIFKRESFSEPSPVKFHLNVTRPISERRILGVCAGIANYMNIDATIVRMFWVIASFLSLGIGIVIYFFFVILIPKESEEIVEES